MEQIFDKNKTYFLRINREGHELVFTATNIEIVGALLSFTDKKGQQFVFPIECLSQAKEEKP